MSEGFDWAAVVDAAVAQAVSAVKAVLAEHPDEHMYGAMFHEFYGDGDVTNWPVLTVGTEETLATTASAFLKEYESSEPDAGMRQDCSRTHQ